MQRVLLTDVPGPESERIRTSNSMKFFIQGVPESETYVEVVFKHGAGCYIEDVDGNWFIDCANTLNLPFGHEDMVFGETPVVNSGNYYTPSRVDLVGRLSRLFPKLGGVQFRSSGAESVEAALRYVWACWPEGITIFSFEGCYHGLTLGARAIMGQSGSPSRGIRQLPFPVGKDIPDLERSIRAEIAAGPVAVVFETVQGNYVRSVPDAFFDMLMTIKREFKERVLLVCDDMLYSIRGGNWQSVPTWVELDVFVAGKSWSGGYPFSFFGVSEVLRSRVGDILGTTTYGGNPVACEAALRTVLRIEREGTLRHVQECEGIVREEGVLQWRKAREVSRAECYGLLFGIEMESVDAARRVGMDFLRKGLLSARIGRVIRFSPALNISAGTLKECVALITSGLMAQS